MVSKKASALESFRACEQLCVVNLSLKRWDQPCTILAPTIVPNLRSWRSNEWSAQSSPRTPQQSSKQGGLVSSGHSWGTPTPTIFQWDQNHKPDDFNGPNYPGFESCGNQCLPRAERWRHGDPLLGLELKCLSPVLTRVVLKSLQLKIRYCNPC